MSDAHVITSAANPKLKWLANLHKPRVRRAEGVIVVEGQKEIVAAYTAGFRPHSFFLAPDIAPPLSLISEVTSTHLISQQLFAKAAYRDTSDGHIGVFYEPETTLAHLHLKHNPLLLVLESVEKPGNLGAIIRTADAAGVDAVIVADEHCDLWNPNAIRASVGTIFTTPLARAPNDDVLSYLHTHRITPYAAALSDRTNIYYQQNYTTPSAFILGTEHHGLSHFWLTHAHTVIIPMYGSNDSLNVSVAAGILTYEAIRQRHSIS